MHAAHRLALSALLLAAGFNAGNAGAVSADKLYTILAPSVWRVFAFDAQIKPISQGSGVVIGPDAMVTNCHVLAKASSILVRQGDVSVTATLKYIDLERDLCQLTARGLRSPAVQLGDSDKLAIGQKIYALGNPINMELTLSDGIVSSLRRDANDRLRYIQISAPISHGSSGGGLFDEDGKLIGITSASVEAGQNLNLAIPVKWLGELAQRSTAALAKYESKTPAAAPAPARAPEAVAQAPTPAPAPRPVPVPVPAPPPVVAKAPAPVVVQQPAAPRAPAVAPAYPRLRAVAPVASGYADIADLDMLLKVAPNARSSYEDFLKAPFPRAFAVSVNRRAWSSWGWVPRDPSWDTDPSVRVLPLCEAHASATCVLYAVDNVVVFKPFGEAANAERTRRKPAMMMNTASIIAKARGAMLLTLALCLAAAGLAHGAEDKLNAALNESVFKLHVSVRDANGQAISGDMVVTQFKPDGDGPFPIAVLMHGRSVKKSDRLAMPRARYPTAAAYFVRRGFAVWVPTRLGYGVSAIDADIEGSGPCENRNYPPAYEAAASTMRELIAHARKQPFADPTRVIALGQSYGGTIAIALAAKHPDGLLATINFAGGGGGDPDNHPRKPCRPDRLQAMFAGYGASARIPTLWVYAQNDMYMGAVEPPRWFAAYAKAGGIGDYVAMPPFSEDGHHLFGKGFALWRPIVDDFLAKRGFPAPRSANAPPASAFAALGDIDKLPAPSAAAREKYQHFLESDVPRAFAIGPHGEYATYSAVDALPHALARCRQLAHADCKLYAVDDQVVWPSDSAPVTAGAPKESTP